MKKYLNIINYYSNFGGGLGWVERWHYWRLEVRCFIYFRSSLNMYDSLLYGTTKNRIWKSIEKKQDYLLYQI